MTLMTSATWLWYVHTAADCASQAFCANSSITDARSPFWSLPAISKTAHMLWSSFPWLAPGVSVCCTFRTCLMRFSFRASVTLPLGVSDTKNSSTNHPPSEEMRAFLMLRFSSVRVCTTSMSVPGRLALSMVTTVMSSYVSLSTSTLGGCNRSSRVSYSSSVPSSCTELCCGFCDSDCLYSLKLCRLSDFLICMFLKSSVFMVALLI
mmetsp:Transcript_17995/g.50284  ORF Transcript_17995/g.50284 Transcript_17995/m.50284 type:complete len:207 (-) Transcript_17995:71-691(-)